MNIQKIDALELLQSLGDKTVDLILTDPPYYKLLNIDWDKQWKTKDDYLNWLENIIKECQRVLKDNGSFYMFCSPEMLIKVGGVVDKYFNVLNTIRMPDKLCRALLTSPDVIRRYINNSEEIIFAEQIGRGDTEGINILYSDIANYFNNQRVKANLSKNECNKILGKVAVGSHYFTDYQHREMTEENYNKLREHMDLKPYEEIKKEYEALRRTFNLSKGQPYNNTWRFKPTPARKGRHPCEKPEDLISYIIGVSSNENDLVVDMFCGSCVVPKCCEAMNRRCIAGDIDDKYFP